MKNDELISFVLGQINPDARSNWAKTKRVSILPTIQRSSAVHFAGLLRFLAYSLKTLWLFTLSDLKTFVLPQTLFGIFGALSGALVTTNPNPNILGTFSMLPKTILWTWLNTLVFDLANQRLPESVMEDSLNKPTRPLASGRIDALQTRRLLLLSIPLILGVTYFYLGSYEETVLLFALTWMYNDLGGSDEDFVTRNLIIGVAYMVYGCGALRVTLNTQGKINQTGYVWSCMIGAVIFTTMQVQDLKDQEGDRTRNRKTAPLMLGDQYARWTIAVPVTLWSVVCPFFWKLGPYASVLPLGLGLVVAVRVVCATSVAADKGTWRLWAYWLAGLYILPVLKNLEGQIGKSYTGSLA